MRSESSSETGSARSTYSVCLCLSVCLFGRICVCVCVRAHTHRARAHTHTHTQIHTYAQVRQVNPLEPDALTQELVEGRKIRAASQCVCVCARAPRII